MTRALLLFLAGCTADAQESKRPTYWSESRGYEIIRHVLPNTGAIAIHSRTWKCKRGHVMHGSGGGPPIYRFYEDGKEYAVLRICQRCLVDEMRKFEMVEVQP